MSFKSHMAGATLLAGLILTGASALAQDPPLRVGRISYLEGTVSFHAGDEDDWSYATLNYPVVGGNAFWTEPDGRSEVQIGAVEVRMDHSTEMEVSQLDENTTRLEVPQGVVNIHFSTPPLNGTIEVMTPEGPIELSHPGTYHIDAGQPTVNSPSNQVQVTALEGELDVRGPNSLLQVMAGETATLAGNPPTFSLQEGNPTEFDNWALARERREEAHEAANYVSPHTTGYEDLDNYGRWSADPDYGHVWYPQAVQADWAPYRDGHWAYINPWGWTWVDNAPWGFAPFHYGRWAYIGNRWGWVPGEVAPRPVYAPALVAFVGGGGGWNVSLAVGGVTAAIGWVPLGPREVFHPYYPTSVQYARNVNITNVNRTEINNITVNNIHNVNVTNYVNQRAATVVPAHAFQQGQPVQKSLVPVSHEQLSRAPAAPTLEHMTPSASARNGGRTMPASAQTGMPNSGSGMQVRHMDNESPSGHAPLNASPGAPHAPEAPHAPVEPQVVHVTPQGQEAHGSLPAQRHEPSAAGTPQQAHAESRNVPAHAPGPQIHHAAVQPQTRAAMAPSQNKPLPRAQVPHPQQQTKIMPTPSGWQRTPPAHEQPHPQPHEAPHPAAGQQPHKENEPH